MFKLGLIGYCDNITKIKKIIKNHFDNIEIVEIEFNDTSQVNDVLKKLKIKEKQLDSILFTGMEPFLILNALTIPQIPWSYLDTNISQVLKILLEAKLVYDYDIYNISIDSYSQEAIIEIFKSINIGEECISIRKVEYSLREKDFLKSILDTHIDNYKNKASKICITGISSIYKELIALGIPVFLLGFSEENLKQHIQHMLLKHKIINNNDNELVVLRIEIDNKNEYSLINDNEYKVMLDKAKVMEEIYLFAQDIQGAVTEIGTMGYMIFSTTNIFGKANQNSKILELLYSINKKTENTVSAGIGYGFTAKEAKHNAGIGLKKSKKQGGNRAYIIHNTDIIGPILTLHREKNEEEMVFDERLKVIAQQTSLSINTIFKLSCIREKNKKNSFTPQELAKEYGVTTRTMNRILEKLEEQRFVEVIGKKIITKAGRPSRVIRLMF